MDKILEHIVAAAEASVPADSADYSHDGLLFCGKCRTPKEYRLNCMGHERLVPCLCKCASEARDAEIAAKKQREGMDRLARIRSVGMRDRTQWESTFENADGRNAEFLAFCKDYCDAWPEMLRENIGLLLWGGVGTGKSYAAACIANEILNQHHAEVMMTNFSMVLKGLYAAEDKNLYIENLVKYPLLIIDDFGVERSSEYTMEQVYGVIDARYRTKKPLIVTTNIPLRELKAPGDMAHERIYSRLLEMCMPVDFGDGDSRAEHAGKKWARAKEIIRGECQNGY
jgi:DNA replication protein DnaC